jgi:hypothetical protein
MARENSDRTLESIRPDFDDAFFLDQVRIGNMTAEDASYLFGLSFDESLPNATVSLDALSSIVSALDNDITDTIGNFIDVETALADGLYEGSLGDYILTVDAIEAMADQITAMITADIGQDLGSITTNLNAVQQAVMGVPLAQVQALENLGDSLSDRLFGWIGDETSTILSVLGRETQDIIDELSDPLDLIQSVTEDIVTKTTDFASALRETIPEIGEKIVEGMAGIGGVVTEGFGAAFGAVLETIGVDKLFDMFSLLGNIGTEVGKELGGLDDLEVRPGSWDAPIGTADAINTVIGGLPWVGSIIHTKHPAEFERIRLDSQAWVRPTPLDPATTLEHIRRFPATAEALKVNLERAGLSDERIQQIMDIREQLPDIGTLVRWQSRGIIAPSEFPVLAGQVGWNPEVAQNFNEEYYGPPPVGDLIRMAVREVFSPEIAEEFGQFEEIPTPYLEWAEKIGLTTEWARNYWAAHWVLPSMQMGFEMLHRGAIDPDQLDALFVAQDVMPFWRDRLKEISYRVVTRVDVRRFHALGIYDEAQVLDAYMKMGFNETNAAEMTQFTVAYNDSTKKGEKARERDLSKSDVIGMYNDGVLDAATTRGYLIQLGYDEAESTVLIEREDIQEMRRERKADISNIIDQAKIKALTYEEAQDRLAALDLTRTETNKALADLARISQTRTRTPSKSDLDDWLSLNLITDGDYAEELRTLGFADRYVALYVEATSAEAESDLLAEEEKAARRREPRSVSKSNLDSLYQAEIIDLAGYTEGLQTLGYREADIANLLEQQTLKLEERRRDEIERLERGETAAVRERLPSRSLLGKLYLKGLISIESYAEGLTLLGFSPENIELLSKLIGAKAEEDASEPSGITQ